MNIILPVMEGEKENYLNSTINKLCHKNDRVLFINPSTAKLSIGIFAHLKLCLADAIHNFK